jgi:DNA repair protein RadC
MRVTGRCKRLEDVGDRGTTHGGRRVGTFAPALARAWLDWLSFYGAPSRATPGCGLPPCPTRPGATRPAPSMALKDLPQAARPREKLLAHGPQALGDAELLALILRVGTVGRSVLQLAQDLLDRGPGLAGLLRQPPEALKGIKGLGPAKRAELAAVLELARRSLAQTLAQRPVFESPQQVKDYLRLQIGHLEHEVFAVLFLDAQHRLIALDEMFRGTLSQTSVYPREVVKRALERNAAAVVLAHNHPSGHAEPSRADEALTQALRAALQLVDVRVLDHLVVGHDTVVSFAERGLL